MDTSLHTRAPRDRSRRPVEGDAAVVDRPAPASRGHEGRGGTGPSANDAVWWVVLHQGAVDYAQSVGAAEQDVPAATRLVAAYREGQPVSE